MTEREALKLALEALELHGQQYPHMVKGYCLDAITAIREALAEQPAQPKGCQCPACKIAPHASDCAVHNEPAYPKGSCDCSSQQQEPVSWRNAALRVGEDLCSVGPFGYYDMTAEQWLDWALSVVTVHAPPARRTWVGLTDDDLSVCDEDGVVLARYWETKLKEKNT